MKLRNGMLAGLGLCALMLAFTAVQYPDFPGLLLRSPWTLTAIVVVLLWNGYAAIRRTQPKTEEDTVLLQYGIRWGLAIALAWTLVTIVPMEAGAPLWFAAAFSGVLMPWIAAALAAIRTGTVRAGMSVGFWSSAIGGLIGFLVTMGVGYAATLSSTLQTLQIPSINALQLAIYIMFFLGTIPGTLGGVLAGWFGLILHRTGKLPSAVAAACLASADIPSRVGRRAGRIYVNTNLFSSFRI